jgi:ABC-type polysaccharide transport system permease subunit
MYVLNYKFLLLVTPIVWHISNGSCQILRGIKCRKKKHWLGIQNFVSILINKFALNIGNAIVIMNLMKLAVLLKVTNIFLILLFNTHSHLTSWHVVEINDDSLHEMSLVYLSVTVPEAFYFTKRTVTNAL